LILVDTRTGGEEIFSIHGRCPACGIGAVAPDPRLFSFNSPQGACPGCSGLGVIDADEESGKDEHARVCTRCGGSRLKPDALAVRIQGKTIWDLVQLPPEALREQLAGIVFAGHRQPLAEPIMAELRSRLARLTGREVVLLDEAPEHHAGMYLMLAGQRTALVGDPGLAWPLFGRAAPPLDRPDTSDRTQRRFDAVAAACQAQGYRVVRMPVALDQDGRTWLTPLNAILDQSAGRSRVYMPVYQSAGAMNEAAERIWSGLGFEVHPIDCSSSYRHFGSLRCLVQVLRRGRSTPVTS
jgi:hypothetical protein